MRDLPRPTHREQIGKAYAALAPGLVIASPLRRTITDFDNIAAALLAMNTHPVHTDYDFAAHTQFGKPLVVSPFLLSCLVAGVMNELRDVHVSDFEIRDLAFGSPVYPGDTIGAEATVESVARDRVALSVQGRRPDGTSFARFSMVLHVKAPGA